MKITKEVLDSSKKLYSEGHSLKEIVNLIERKFGLKINSESIRKRLIKSGLKIRDRRNAIILSYRRKEPVDIILKMYRNKISIREISRHIGLNRLTIRKILKENEVELRSEKDSIRLANLTHERKNFCGNKSEQAYMIGLVAGDLTALKKSKYTIRVATNSTHKKFLEMIKSVFEKYSHVKIYPTKDGSLYGWSIFSDLEAESFGFLLGSKGTIFLDSMDRSEFLNFLAGLVDSDGSIMVRKIRGNMQFVLRIYSENLELLEKIESNLKYFFHAHPYIELVHRAGKQKVYAHKNIVYRKDYYSLNISNREDFFNLLKILPLRHPEKILKKSVAFNLLSKGIVKWVDAEPHLNSARNQIKSEVVSSVEEAKISYEKKGL